MSLEFLVRADNKVIEHGPEKEVVLDLGLQIVPVQKSAHSCSQSWIRFASIHENDFRSMSQMLPMLDSQY